jgi:dephospho-CoA kinase
MLKVGLTGSIAVGKTFVVTMLAKLGCATFDADKVAHLVMEPGRPAYTDIVGEFGEEILAENGSINRQKLGSIVFADEARRKRLNEIVHPRVIEEQNKLLEAAEAKDPDGIAIIDAALMIESGGYKRFDKLIVVHCDLATQIDRLTTRNQISRAEAEQRIAAQMSSEEKLRYADYAIDTSGSLEATCQRVTEVYEELRRLQQSS